MAKKKNESAQDWLAELERNLEVVALGEAEYEAEIAAVEARHREYLKAKKKLAALAKAHLAEIGSGKTAHAETEGGLQGVRPD